MSSHSDIQHSGDAPGRAAVGSAADDGTHVGWVVFAGVMLFLVGAFQLIVGLVAIFEEHYYLVTKRKLVIHVDFTTWGWVHVAIGAVALIAGLGVMAGMRWARIVGIVLAMGSAVVNLAFVSAYPVWGVTLIALDVLVIYALAVHGSDVEPS